MLQRRMPAIIIAARGTLSNRLSSEQLAQEASFEVPCMHLGTHPSELHGGHRHYKGAPGMRHVGDRVAGKSLAHFRWPQPDD